jgi:hypothetical protein
MCLSVSANPAPRRFKEMEAYILARRDELTGRGKPAAGGKGGGSGGAAAEPAAAVPKGFSS